MAGLEPAGRRRGAHSFAPFRQPDGRYRLEKMNAGRVYVTLTRLEEAGLVTVERAADGADRSDRKVDALTPDGQQRVAEWIAELRWPRPDLAEFHLKLIAAAAAGLLLEGMVLRLQADRRWLEACEQNWTSRRSGS